MEKFIVWALAITASWVFVVGIIYGGVLVVPYLISLGAEGG